ncbi:LAS1 like ribosome biogenesis factor, variant 2 [Balamuthia mandrillaris]
MEETRVTEANDEQQQQQHLVESGRKESEEKEKEKGTKGEEQSEESHKKQEAKSSEDQEQKEQVPPRKEYQQQPPPPPPSKKEEQRSAAPPKPQAAAANNGGGWGWGSLWSASSALVNDYILPLVGDTDEEQAEKREETEATNDAVKHQEEEEEEEQDRAVELGKAAYSYVESMASAASSSLSAALSDKAVLERGREVGEWSTTMSFEFLERMGKATFDVLSKELAAAAAGISPQEDQANTTTSQRTDFTSPSLSHQNAASSDRSSFEACFEEKHGSIHLQALENLSTQCVVRLGQADGDLLAQLQESFQSIKDVLAQEEEDDDDDDDDDDEDEDEEEHEDESVGKDKRQVKDAKKASASPLPVNGLVPCFVFLFRPFLKVLISRVLMIMAFICNN